MFQWYLLMLCTPGQGALLFTGCRALAARFGEFWRNMERFVERFRFYFSYAHDRIVLWEQVDKRRNGRQYTSKQKQLYLPLDHSLGKCLLRKLGSYYFPPLQVQSHHDTSKERDSCLLKHCCPSFTHLHRKQSMLSACLPRNWILSL